MVGMSKFKDREKFCPSNHHLPLLGNLRDANCNPSGQIFLSHSHTHDRFLYCELHYPYLYVKLHVSSQ